MGRLGNMEGEREGEDGTSEKRERRCTLSLGASGGDLSFHSSRGFLAGFDEGGGSGGRSERPVGDVDDVGF